jgi:hypothetical protein
VLRRLTSVAALAATIGTALVLTAPAAYAGPSESEFVSLTNHARASAGLRGYTVASDLLALARKHSAEMAAKGTIYHNPNLGSDVSNWRAVGENVGMGGSASSIHNAFMNSQHHRDNILDRDFTQVGIGTAVSKDGVLFVTEVFRQPMSSTSTTTAPKPAPRRTATTTAPRTTVRAASTPARPVPAKAPSAAALLQARLAAAASFAGQARAAGALDRAITYVGVMGQLG